MGIKYKYTSRYNSRVSQKYTQDPIGIKGISRIDSKGDKKKKKLVSFKGGRG